MVENYEKNKKIEKEYRVFEQVNEKVAPDVIFTQEDLDHLADLEKKFDSITG